MIEVKVNGPQKRTIIESLRYEVCKQKNSLYLLRFKSLPTKTKKSSQRILIDIPQCIKNKQIPSIKKQFPDFFQKKSTLRQYYERAKSLQNVKFNQQKHKLESLRRRSIDKFLKQNMISDHEFSAEKQVKNRVKTLNAKIKKDECINESIQSYIKRNMSLDSALMNKQCKSRNGQSVIHLEGEHDRVRVPRRLEPIHSKSRHDINQNHSKDLTTQELSPSICQIHQLFNKNKSKAQDNPILKRRHFYQNSQNYFFQDTNQFKRAISPAKRNQREKTLFKNSIGPWRNSGFAFNV